MSSMTFKARRIIGCVSIALTFSVGSKCLAFDHIDAFYYNKSDSFISEVSQLLNEHSKQQTFVLHEFNAMDDIGEQISSIETAISKGNQPLVVNLVAPSTANTVIELAKKHNNPVIFFNRKPSNDVLR